MLLMEVIPEYSLRHNSFEFTLGMPLNQTFDLLSKKQNLIKIVEFYYSDKQPFEKDLQLNMPLDGIKLYFDPFKQSLKIIEVYDMSKIILQYNNQTFNSQYIKPTLEEIDKTFGATRPPQHCSNSDHQILSFRGLSFLLAGSDVSGVMLISQKERTQIKVIGLSIFSGVLLTEALIPSHLPSTSFNGNLFLEKLEAKLKPDSFVTKLKMNLMAQIWRKHNFEVDEPVVFQRVIKFGDNVQDVISSLGSPSRVYFKEKDKMKIHSPFGHRMVYSSATDYFYNYFTLGLDILFHGVTNRVIKLVLHTNMPGHCNFNSYYRCNYELKITDSSNNFHMFNTFSKWSSIESVIRPSTSNEPIVMNRSLENLSNNPFGPTHCYGYQNIIFEVMPSNDYISSITFYSPPH